jgi:hypothetical protein
MRKGAKEREGSEGTGRDFRRRKETLGGERERRSGKGAKEREGTLGGGRRL